MKVIFLSALFLFEFFALSKALSLRLYNETTVHLWTEEEDIGYRFNCKVTSYYVISCIKNFIDLNQDDGITKHEIDKAKSHYLKWYEKLAAAIAKLGSTDDIVERCDLNNNSKIDVDDLIEWNHRCRIYNTDSEANVHTGHLCLCNCESLEGLAHYICDRAVKEIG